MVIHVYCGLLLVYKCLLCLDVTGRKTHYMYVSTSSECCVLRIKTLVYDKLVNKGQATAYFCVTVAFLSLPFLH